MAQKKLPKKVQGFLGQAVGIAEGVMSLDIPGFTLNRKYKTYAVIEGDPTIAALEELGYDLRVWLPSTLGICDHNMGRLNVQITEKDGAWRITRLWFG